MRSCLPAARGLTFPATDTLVSISIMLTPTATPDRTAAVPETRKPAAQLATLAPLLLLLPLAGATSLPTCEELELGLGLLHPPANSPRDRGVSPPQPRKALALLDPVSLPPPPLVVRL